MTDEEIDKLEAGPELDELVAENVIGWQNDNLAIEPFSSDIAAAWEVVGQLTSDYQISLSYHYGWTCVIGMAVEWSSNALTAPLAICRAALKAVNK